MKALTRITLLGAALSMCLHFYLAFHYYPVKYGFSTGPSMCSVNATFDCDAVASSDYSSVFDIPIALWGFSTNLVIFVLVMCQWWGWSDHSERLRRWALLLCGLSVAGSVTMGIISTTLHSYCLFCMTLYVISIAMFECYRRTLQEPFFTNWTSDLSRLWAESKGILIGFATIPALAWFGHSIFMQAYEITDIEHLVQEVISEWKMAPHYDFPVEPGLTKGPARSEAAMTITEFADFRCHHCRNAFPSLENFTKTHPRVRLEFYNFPLDGDCNDNMPANGMSCRLAEAVMCADKQGEGWPMHHAVYDAQESINEIASIGDLDHKITELAATLGIKTDSLLQCMDDPKIKDAIHMEGKQGFQVKVEGTPTIFVNGRKLERGMMIPVLESALESKN